MADVTNPIIETIARAIEPDWFGENERHGRHPLDNRPKQHLDYQERARSRASAALTALEANGWAVVPVEPTRDQIMAAPTNLHAAMSGPFMQGENARAVYRAMIQAGKAKG